MVAQVEGIREALRELGKIDPRLRRSVGGQLRKAAEPLRAAARARLPANPLSGWTSGRYAYDQAAAQRGITIRLGGGRGDGGGGSFELIGKSSTLAVLTLIQRNAGGAVYEVAGRRSSGKSAQGAAFIAGLNAVGGQASRAMWPAAEEELADVERAVMVAVRDVERQINARLR